MIIKLGILGSEITFNFVNVNYDRVKPNSEHALISGAIKFQEANNSYRVYSFEFVYLTYAQKVILEGIFALSNILNVQFETEDYDIDHGIKFRNPFSAIRSQRYPPGYEATIIGVEVGFEVAPEVTISTIVGSRAINRSSYYPSDSTLIVAERPATFSGKITYIEIFAYQAMASVTVATFTQVAENVFTARDSEFIGDVGGDFKRPFGVDLDVVEGDVIGIFWNAGYIERDDKGSGIWIKTGNQTSCNEVIFSFVSNRTISLYANRNVPA